MIRRSIIFYSSDLTKNIAINIAKGLNGYVDIENYSYENKHIDMDPFHNVIYVIENKNDDLIKSIKKYAIYYTFKRKYLCVLSDKNSFLKDIEFKNICYKDIKKLVVKSIEIINNED